MKKTIYETLRPVAVNNVVEDLDSLNTMTYNELDFKFWTWDLSNFHF